jgi:hypothetical protein
MEHREERVFDSVYSDLSLYPVDFESVKIHSILTAVKYLQGWLGLFLYGGMVGILLHPAASGRKAFLPVFVFFVLSHFALGLYLTPGFWSLLALVALLRRATAEKELK